MLASVALSPRVFAAHWPIRLPALRLSVAKVAVGRVHRIERRVEHDHHQARVARLLDRRHDRLGVGRDDREALGAGGDQVLDRSDLSVVVAVELAGGGDELDAEFLGLLLRTFAHLDEEGVGFGLGDEADDVGGGGRTGEAECERARDGKYAEISVHVFSPSMTR